MAALNTVPVLASVQSLMQMFAGKAQDFVSEINNVHMVWLEEIQQEANRMFTRDFNAEPELMPKTPSQKRNTRRKRVSVGRQEESPARRRFSKGRRSNLRGSGSSKALNCIAEEKNASLESTSKTETTRPKRATRKKQVKEDEEEVKSPEVVTVKAEVIEIVEDEVEEQKDAAVEEKEPSSTTESLNSIPSPKVVVAISQEDRLSAELAVNAKTSTEHAAANAEVSQAAQTNKSQRGSVRLSLKLRHSKAGLRHSMTQESVRRASRRSMLKRKAARMGNSTCGSNTGDDADMESLDEESEVMGTSEPAKPVADAVQSDKNTEELACENETVPAPPPAEPLGRITRSVAANSPKFAPQPLSVFKIATPDKSRVTAGKRQTQGLRLSTKRKAPDVAESPSKRVSPPKKSNSIVRPNMRTFLHTVQKNQMLMMTPTSLGRSTVLKSFIKHTTPIKMDQKTGSGVVTKELYKLEALKKKQEQENERMKKMEEEKRKKQEELKRKRDERLKRVYEAKVKEEQKEEEKKKKIEQKMAQIEEKNDKKKIMALKRQEELELKKKQEEEAKKKLQQEEERRQLEAKKKAEEEERAQKLAEAQRALELKREQERERERERQAALERERVEREKALALQRELERAAREKERRELEEKRKLEQQLRIAAEEKAAREREAAKKQAPPTLNVTVDLEKSVLNTPAGKAAAGGVFNQTIDIDRTPLGKGAGGNGLNVTVDIEKSPQSYSITPKGGNKVPSTNPDCYGMDQNSDDSTDEETAPRKPIPSWALGDNLQLLVKKQYFSPPDLHGFFGSIEPPNLEKIFYKSKPRYCKRTSSAVWNSPPAKY